MDPALLLSLCEGLPEGSMTYAMQRGGDYWQYFLGADRHSYQLAAVYDAVGQNTVALARVNGNRKFKVEPYPLPEIQVKQKAQKDSIRKGGVAALYRVVTQTFGKGEM